MATPVSGITISKAAALLGVSDDTVRRLIAAGELKAVRPEGRSRGALVDGPDLARLMSAAATAPDDRPVVGRSARNRFPGIVSKVTKDELVAVVEIQAGPHRVVSLMTREAVDELGLEPGMVAVASVKSTNVVVELPG